MRIQHNIMAMNAYRNYSNNTSALSKNLEKLSSGYKINRAGDDAAGLAISEKMRAQITGLETAQKNAKDGISLVQTAEGALTEVHDMLNRMYELASQSSNGTYDDQVDRANLQKELDALRNEIDRISQSANFNGKSLFTGGTGGSAPTGKVTFTPDVAASTAFGVSDIDLSAFTGSISATTSVTMAYNSTGNKLTVKIGLYTFEATITKQKSSMANASITLKATGSKGGTITVKFGASSKVGTDATTVASATVGTVKPGEKTGKMSRAGSTAPTEGKKWESEITFGSGAFASGDTIVIGSKTYTFSSSPSGSTDVKIDTNAQKSFQNFIQQYNASTANNPYTLSLGSDGKLVFTAKSASTTTKPTITITTADGKVKAGAVTEQKSSSSGGGTSFTLQIGEDSSSYNQLTFSIEGISPSDLSLDKLDIGTQEGAQSALDVIKAAINKVSTNRGNLGAIQNRLEHTINNLSVMTENIQDAESTIRDTDVADEMMAYTKNNILVQSAQAMLAQANQVPQGVLQLLQ